MLFSIADSSPHGTLIHTHSERFALYCTLFSVDVLTTPFFALFEREAQERTPCGIKEKNTHP